MIKLISKAQPPTPTPLTRFVLHAQTFEGTAIQSSVQDFKDLKDGTLTMDNWQLHPNIQGKFWEGQSTDGIRAYLGELVLFYSEGTDVKDNLGVRIKYEQVNDAIKAPEAFRRERYIIEPFGDRWQRDGLEFPEFTAPIETTGGLHRMDILADSRALTELRVRLSKVATAIRESNEV